jgi:serine/threonine protein phosphatase PrpC
MQSIDKRAKVIRCTLGDTAMTMFIIEVDNGITSYIKFIVLASDGIWEFLKNIDVARIIHPFYLKKNAEGAAESLVREAFKRWKKEEDVIDDITCIVIFLDVKI